MRFLQFVYLTSERELNKMLKDKKLFAPNFNSLLTTGLRAIFRTWGSVCVTDKFNAPEKLGEFSLRTGSQRGRKKNRRKRDSVSEASGSRSLNPRAKRVRSSPDRSRLVPLTLDYTRLARSKTNREPVRRLWRIRIPVKIDNCSSKIVYSK